MIHPNTYYGTFLSHSFAPTWIIPYIPAHSYNEMPPVSRETVIAAVSEYGLAWVQQDSKRIGLLFTEDAVYVERAFDKKATFRGRASIEKYWTYQVCGKQTNIAFRHVESEMVRDADRPIAVVKWLAEFDNRREKRSNDKTNKRVKFCQMAKLVFEGTKIAYLEEYAQGMGGSGVRWPGLDASDEVLCSKIRFDPEKPKNIQCERCLLMFPSRTKLFGHLRETQARPDGKPGCVPSEEEKEQIRHVFVCFSLTYSLTCQEPEKRLLGALEALAKELDVIDNFESSLTWAVPPSLTASAILNVVAAKLPRCLVEHFQGNALIERLNEELSSLEINSGNNDAYMLRIHMLGIVDRLFSAQRREFEKYVAFVPWSLLRPQGSTLKRTHKHPTPLVREEEEECNNPQNDKKSLADNKNQGCWRQPLELRAASQYVTLELAQRIKHGARLMSDNLKNIRIRTGALDEPWHRWCKISISMLQKKPGDVEQLVGLLLGYASRQFSEEELLAALPQEEGTTREEEGHPVPGMPEPPLVLFPSGFVSLLEPFLAPYETKNKLSLCSQNNDASDGLKSSVSTAEQVILRQMECKEDVIEEWASSRRFGYLNSET